MDKYYSRAVFDTMWRHPQHRTEQLKALLVRQKHFIPYTCKAKVGNDR